MNPMRTLMKVLLGAAVVTAGLFIANNSSWIDPIAKQPSLLAHKGLGQNFDLTNIKSDDCTATRMLPPRHSYLENTIASIGEAFELGADVVELDIHPTTDGQFAIFHDWTLDCRTNGTGVTRTHSMAELKRIDIGYGYTADGGKTFPFRGKGVGLMPTLNEVLAAFPDKPLLINVKSNDPAEGRKLAEYLAKLPKVRRDTLMAYGGGAPIAALREVLPEIRTMSRETLRSCYLQYIALGWSGYVPSACHNSVLLVPTNVGPWMWGWPHRFQRRLTGVNTVFFAIAPYYGGRFSHGLDGDEALRLLPEGYVGGISTDQIDTVTALLRRMRR
jgi:glycerophosphoryl diester phosphodiesterase